MGTERDAERIKKEIKRLSKSLAWTQNKLAREIYVELNEWDDDEEILRFQERFKKEMQRKTTNIERLKKYLEILVAHPDASRVDCVFNQYVPQGCLSETFITGMGEISQELDNAISDKDDTQ